MIKKIIIISACISFISHSHSNTTTISSTLDKFTAFAPFNAPSIESDAKPQNPAAFYDMVHTFTSPHFIGLIATGHICKNQWRYFKGSNPIKRIALAAPFFAANLGLLAWPIYQFRNGLLMQEKYQADQS